MRLRDIGSDRSSVNPVGQRRGTGTIRQGISPRWGLLAGAMCRSQGGRGAFTAESCWCRRWPVVHCRGARGLSGQSSAALHDERGLTEWPLNGRSDWGVRRFVCDRTTCRRKTFVERVDRLIERYQGSRLDVKQWLRARRGRAGGRAGEQLCRQLHVAAGRSKLLGLFEPRRYRIMHRGCSEWTRSASARLRLRHCAGGCRGRPGGGRAARPRLGDVRRLVPSASRHRDRLP